VTTSPPPMPPTGWYADPWGVSRWRWWDGTRWTGYTDDWVAASSARPTPAVTVDESVPIRAGWIAIGGAVVGVALSIVIYAVLRGVVGVRASSPILALFAQLGLWVGLLGACRIAVRRHGTGSLRDLGLRMRGVDLALGVGFGAALLVGVGTLALVLERIGIHPHRQGLVDPMERGPLTVVVILFVAVIGAPFVEELFFRGLLLSGLVQRFGVVGGILAQAAIFGAVHLGPTDARGNLGVFLLIAPVGAVLGVLRVRYRRLGTGMITHAVYNAIIVSVALTR
jgi:CAAX protease family protein